VAENLLDRQFARCPRMESWVADITSIPTREGWLYLAAVEDLYARMVVGWSMADHTESRLVSMPWRWRCGGACRGRACWPIPTGAASTPASTTSGCWRGTGSRAA